jgi:hypothetical protein
MPLANRGARVPLTQTYPQPPPVYGESRLDMSDARRTLGSIDARSGGRVITRSGRHGKQGELRHRRGSDWQLYYSHWGGCRILDALIGGPDLALRYAASLRRCEKDDWCAPSWADGGAVIDLDRRRVLFFGEGLMTTMNERRALMSVLATVWPGYEICWAYDGTAELAGYVGAQLRPDPWDRQPRLTLARGRNHMCHLISLNPSDPEGSGFLAQAARSLGERAGLMPSAPAGLKPARL